MRLKRNPKNHNLKFLKWMIPKEEPIDIKVVHCRDDLTIFSHEEVPSVTYHWPPSVKAYTVTPVMHTLY